MTSKKLASLDWIKAGFLALKDEGPSAIRVEPLARSLKVSKGSFYWHFKNLADLKARMLTHWEERATAEVIEMVQQEGGDADAMLAHLVGVAMSDMDSPYGGPLTEISIRHWAQIDDNTKAAQTRVDAARKSFLAALFQSGGCDAQEASRWANLFFYAYTGSSFAPAEDRVQMATDLLNVSPFRRSP